MDTLLRTVYGAGAAEQFPRYRAALDAFRQQFGPGEVYAFRAPGRVNLIGEHTDYNHGYVMPAALDKDIVILARPRSDAAVRLHNLEADFSPELFTISADIPPAPVGHWSNYTRAAAQAVARTLNRDLRGFDGLVAGGPPYGVPRGAGLSSSSAFVVAALVTVAYLNAWRPDPVRLGQLASEAEWYVGTRGGIMDQFTSILARRDHALFLDCRPDAQGQYRMEHVPLPAGFQLLIVNSGVQHSNTRGDYNRRVAECRAGVALLRRRHPGITHLRDLETIPWPDLEPHLPQSVTVAELAAQGADLGDVPNITPAMALKVRARCRHVWSENHRVLDAITAMKAGDVAALGRLLDAAHASARDDYDISTPELEVLVNAAREVPGVTGARLTGAGWGGCIVALVQDDAVDAFEQQVKARYEAEVGLTPDIFACRAGPGAGMLSSEPIS